MNPLAEIRNSLIKSISLTIKKRISSDPKWHKVLVKRLYESGSLLNTAFISLNYDIIIDNRLTEKHHLDYGVEFINSEDSDNSDRQEPKKAVKLFKLHGSLNWLYCPTCLNIRLTPRKKTATKLATERTPCPICNGLLKWIIVLPTYFKPLSNYYLRQVWVNAEKDLRQIKRIYFCGYSFPDADIHIKYLLKRIEISLKNDLEVFIINHQKRKKKHQALQEKKRYQRFFKNGRKIHYKEFSFQKFCRDGVGDLKDCYR